jgi:hypothetical protein
MTDQPNTPAGKPADSQAAKNQELISRYVAAVRRRLPQKDARDITAELREAVASRLEAREAELDRPADKAEMVALLRTFGSPMLAAARYTGRQYLIGPDLYPYYGPTARIVVGIVAAVAMVGFLVQGVLSEHPLFPVLNGLAAAWNGGLLAFGVVTVVFVVLEQTKTGPKLERAWRPEQLPRDIRDKPKSLFESLFSLAWDAIFIGWWMGLLHFPNTLPGEAGAQGLALDFNSAAGAAVHLPVLAIAAVQAMIHIADLIRPVWSRLRGIVASGVDIGGLGVVWALARHGPLFTVSGPEADADRIARLNEAFVAISQVIVWSLALGFAIALTMEIWRLARSFHFRAPAALA